MVKISGQGVWPCKPQVLIVKISYTEMYARIALTCYVEISIPSFPNLIDRKGNGLFATFFWLKVSRWLVKGSIPWPVSWGGRQLLAIMKVKETNICFPYILTKKGCPRLMLQINQQFHQAALAIAKARMRIQPSISTQITCLLVRYPIFSSAE